MFKNACLVSLWLLAATAAANTPNSAPPTQESIRELLKVTDARNVLDSMWVQMDGYIKAMQKQAQPAGQLSPKAQAIVDRGTARMMDAVKSTLNWETLEPIYIRVYHSSLTQDELNGMLQFYKTPPGQAMVKKLPVIIRSIMGEMPVVMKPAMEKMQAIQRDMIQQLKDEAAAESAHQPAQ